MAGGFWQRLTEALAGHTFNKTTDYFLHTSRSEISLVFLETGLYLY